MGLIILEAIGWVILLGVLLIYSNTSRVISIIKNAEPVERLTEDKTGIVRVEGAAVSEKLMTDEGMLRREYALLQKEPFNWTCSRSGCDYKIDDSESTKIWGEMTVNGVHIKAERYQFYSNWLPLNAATVEDNHFFNIHERTSPRPLIEVDQKSMAYGYHAISPGDWVTVIGEAKQGELQPIALPGNEDMQSVILIGDHVDQMISKEKGIRTRFLIVGIVIMLMLLPTNIGRVRKLYRKIETRRASKQG